MTEVEAAKLVTMLTAAFPDGLRFLDEKQQTATRAMYRKFLVDLPYREGNEAVVRLIASAEKLPSIATLRATITLVASGREALAGQVWGEVLKLRASQARSLSELDPTLRQCIDSMGWLKTYSVFAGDSRSERWYVALGENEAADRARFMELWDQLQARRTHDRVVGALAPPIHPRQTHRIATQEPRKLGEIVSGLSLPDPEDA